MDDTTQRVFKLAQECIEELRKKVEYIELLEQYIEELESGLEVSAVESVQLEQPLEMENEYESSRPRAVRARPKTSDEDCTRRVNQDSDGASNGDGGDPSTSSSVDNNDAG